MNYGEIKHNIISFGFAEQSDYDEYEALGYTYDAINQAIMQLNEQFPYIDTFEFEIDETDEGPYEIDMGARDGFLELAKDTPVVIEVNGKDVFKPFGAYEVKKERILHINADENKGTFRVYYNRACTTINAETADTFTPELPLKAHLGASAGGVQLHRIQRIGQIVFTNELKRDRPLYFLDFTEVGLCGCGYAKCTHTVPGAACGYSEDGC